MNGKINCLVCGKDYYPQQKWMHEHSDAARKVPEAVRPREVYRPASLTPSRAASDGFDRKAYQRRYMRHWRALESTWRAVRSGRADWWPKRA